MQNIHTNLIGRKVRVDTGRGIKHGEIVGVYLVDYHVQFLVECYGELITANRESITLES